MRGSPNRLLFKALALAVAVIGAPFADDWGGMATISTTMGINANRICMGESSRGDIGCPTYAPTITSTGGISTTANISTTGLSIADGIYRAQFVPYGTNSLGFQQANSGGMTYMFPYTGLTSQTAVFDVNNGRYGFGINMWTPSATMHITGSSRLNGFTTVNANISATAALDVYGTISATGLTINGVSVGGIDDRIVSGTALLTASTGGSLSLSNTGNGNTTFYVAAATTSDSMIRVGAGRSGNGFSYLDFVGDATYTTYGLRLIRNNTGANGSSYIQHRGTGDFIIRTDDGGAIALQTSSLERLRITSTGLAGIGTTTPAATLDVSGSIYSRAFDAAASTSIDFSQANVAYTSAACGAFTLTGMQNGGAYTLVVKGSGTGPASFTHSGLTPKTTGTLTCTSAKHTVFSILRAGTDFYVSMVSGF